VDTSRFDGPPLRRPADRPTLAFVGRLDEPRKGFPVLRRAWPLVLRDHPDARLVVVGEGSRRALAGLDRDAAARVDLLGRVDDDEKAGVLASADVLVAPNTGGESFGIVLVEAMAAGAAVVASDIPAFQGVLGRSSSVDRLGVTFRAGDATALAEAVGRTLADPRRTAMTARARLAAASYDWAVLTPRIVAVYEQVLDGRLTERAG
jgi:phosphatidylinositol alpha-mannosyltransferase